jgi:trk system potassium uptake protein
LFGRLSASRLIVYGFLALVAGGTVSLKLPWATTDGISLVNAFFVAVSCSTVTGLSTVAIPETFTHFGELVMMVLMQLGGLGIMTVTTLAALLVGQRVGFRRLLAVSEETENAGSPRNTLGLLFQIARITFTVELLGAVALSIGFVQAGLGLGEGVFQGIFHAIMAFCNAGFATLPGDDLISYAGNWLIVVALVCVITLGGLGFPVLVDLYHYRESPRLSVHSMVVLITSSALVVVGVLSVAVMEWTNPHTLGGESMSTKAAMSLFQGVTPRTAGFQTVSYPEMREPTLVVQTVLMFIGTAPTSTGGGIKVTTLALVVLIVVAQVRGQDRITLFGARCPGP